MFVIPSHFSAPHKLAWPPLKTESTQKIFPARLYTVKKGSRFSSRQPGCYKPSSPWRGILKLYTARESLVSDIPARDGKSANLFNSVCTVRYLGVVARGEMTLGVVARGVVGLGVLFLLILSEKII